MRTLRPEASVAVPGGTCRRRAGLVAFGGVVGRHRGQRGLRRADALWEMHARIHTVERFDPDRLFVESIVAAAHLAGPARFDRLLADEPRLSREGLLYGLLDRFAADAPAAAHRGLRLRARQYRYGPSNGDGQVYWDLLLRLDLQRAHHELIGYFGRMARPAGFPRLRPVHRVAPGEVRHSGEVVDAIGKWLNHLDNLDRRLGPGSEPVRPVAEIRD